jgi:DNA-binding MarR family transcriptional regulator
MLVAGDDLPEERKQRIKAKTAALEAEYLTLQELRKKAGLTQTHLSKGLKMPQSNLSRLEKKL